MGQVLIDQGALKMALNVLRRAGKDEVADELEKSAVPDGLDLVHKQLAPDAVGSINSIKCAMCSNKYTPRPGFAQCPNCGA